jgi:hypothetical protein
MFQPFYSTKAAADAQRTDASVDYAVSRDEMGKKILIVLPDIELLSHRPSLAAVLIEIL